GPHRVGGASTSGVAGPSGMRRALAILAATIWLVPYVWMVSTSFKPLREISASPASPLPAHPTLEGYREVFAAIPVSRYVAITIAMAVAIATLQILLALPAGYAPAKLRFRGRRLAFAAVVACLLVRAQ